MILYVRLGCHLCTEAWALLTTLGISVQRVNIDRDQHLQTQYGLLVPVLYDPAHDKELIYPFDAEDIQDFLKNL